MQLFYILAIQFITCGPGKFFTLVYIYSYVCFTVSAFTMAALTIERFIVVFYPMKALELNVQRNSIRYIILFIIILSFGIYSPLTWTEIELYWNPDTGNLDLNGSYASWSLSISMMTAFSIIFPINIALLIKMKKQENFRSVFR